MAGWFRGSTAAYGCRSRANVTYSMMCSSRGDALEWRPPFLQQRLQLGLCNSSGKEEDDMALCMHGKQRVGEEAWH